MARPKKKELPTHTSFITLRITPDLYEVLTADAKAAHLSRSKYIRQLITDHHPIVHQEIVCDNPELLERIRDLGRIGSNLNQIARYLNGGGKFTEGMAELKLLVDSVQAAKFITDTKSKVLIKKLETLASNYEARQLQRQVVISGRIKTVNKSVYNNVDTIYTAIGEGKQITFHYFQWDVHGNQVLRHNGALYQISPWCLMWDDEYYYLVAYDVKTDLIKHYRVDKMKDLNVIDEKRLGQEAFKNFDMARYSKAVFGMYGGEETCITLECENDKAGIIIDRFGKDLTLFPSDKDHFTVHVNVIPSGQFLGWIISLGKGVKITGPEQVVRKMQEETKRLMKEYL
jgi:predicted DNA-binding transcriptional regulator YafY